MEVTNVESFVVEVPLDEPVSVSTRTITERRYPIVRVHTDEGVTGEGFTTAGYQEGTGQVIADFAGAVLAPMIEGEDPRDTERLFETMFDRTVGLGRKGLVLRAISEIDIALWDAKAKAAGDPLYKHLGANADSVPAYASGGYYREGKGLEGLREEMERYVERGHDVVKMKLGRLSTAEDAERVRVVREAIGDDRTLLMDANCVWEAKQEAVRACRAFGEYDPHFIEEPVAPDSVRLLAGINDTLDYPVAAGEQEATRYGFDELLREGAVDVIQPNANRCGGVTEWMRIARNAATRDVPVAPHLNWNVHAHLLAAIENGRWVEYFYRENDVYVFDEVLAETLAPEDGEIRLPDTPGHGFELDDAKVEAHRV